MRLSLFIAWRYLFSKKKQNAINIISAISVVGVTVGTTALIVVLSVFNGMDMLLQESTDSFTPDLVVFPAEGKYAVFDSAFCNRLEASPDIASYHQVIEEKALARYGDYTTPVVVKGVDGAYLEDSGFAAHILDGVMRHCWGTEWQPSCAFRFLPSAPWCVIIRIKMPLRWWQP